MKTGPTPSRVLEQSEDVAVRVGDGSHQAAATHVAYGLFHGGPGSRHLGQLGLDSGTCQ